MQIETFYFSTVFTAKQDSCPSPTPRVGNKMKKGSKPRDTNSNSAAAERLADYRGEGSTPLAGYTSGNNASNSDSTTPTTPTGTTSGSPGSDIEGAMMASPSISPNTNPDVEIGMGMETLQISKDSGKVSGNDQRSSSKTNGKHAAINRPQNPYKPLASSSKVSLAQVKFLFPNHPPTPIHESRYCNQGNNKERCKYFVCLAIKALTRLSCRQFTLF